MKVATGKSCHSKLILKQLIQTKAIDACQLDAAKIGGISEAFAVYFMAHKFKSILNLYLFEMTNAKMQFYAVPVSGCASGLGQHLQCWDYVSLSGSKEERCIDSFDSMNSHLEAPIQLQGGVLHPSKVLFNYKVLNFIQFLNGTV